MAASYLVRCSICSHCQHPDCCLSRSPSCQLRLLFLFCIHRLDPLFSGGVLPFLYGARKKPQAHLIIDYLAILLAFCFIIHRIATCHGLYQTKYAIILGDLLLVILLNVVYMVFSLPLDASIIFYGLAGTLLFFCTEYYVPRRLISISIGRAVDDMNEGLILFDIHNNCIYANAFSKDRFTIDPDNFSFESEPIATVQKELANSGERFGTVEYIKEIPEGSKKHEISYRIRHRLLTDKHQREIGSYFLIEDITEGKHFLSEIQKAKNEADQANQAKSLFLANMSHEIRTPLNSVLGMNELILRQTKDPEITDYAESIRSSGENLLSLISDILDFSKIEANKMELHETDYDPHQILRDCFATFRQSAQEKKLTLKISCDATIPSRLHGDLPHIKQVLSNIISNAIKYTKEGVSPSICQPRTRLPVM